MSQSWIHTNKTPNGTPAILRMRFSVSLGAGLCADGEKSNYQPKLNGLDRCELNI
jgi:hypothetical protein